MKVILFLAAVYALIYNQSQQKKPPTLPPPAAVNYSQIFTGDTMIKHSASPALYINVPPSSILSVAATPAVMKSY